MSPNLDFHDTNSPKPQERPRNCSAFDRKSWASRLLTFRVMRSGIVVSQLGRRLAEARPARALSPEDKHEEERNEWSSLGGARKRAAHLAFRPSDDGMHEPDGFFELRLVHGFGLAALPRPEGSCRMPCCCAPAAPSPAVPLTTSCRNVAAGRVPFSSSSGM
jgi:hypothetical protein